MLTRWILRKCEPVCVGVCAWRCLYVRVCACICKNYMYTFPLVAALSVRRCVRVYNVYVFVLNVFLYKIGSSGSSTSRRTTLALRMKPDLQKYVARVFRVFGTFSPLSCPQFSLFLGLVRSISLIPLTPIRSVILLFPFHTLPITRPCIGFSLFFFRQNSYAPFRSCSPPLPSSKPVCAPLSSPVQKSFSIEIWISDLSTIRRGKDPRHLAESSFLPHVASYFFLAVFFRRSHHLWQQRSREDPLACRRENRQFRWWAAAAERQRRRR